MTPHFESHAKTKSNSPHHLSSENVPAINTLYCYVVKEEKKLQLRKSRWTDALIVLVFSKAVVAFFPLLFLVKFHQFMNPSLVSSSKLRRTVWFHVTAHLTHCFKVWFIATNLEIIQKTMNSSHVTEPMFLIYLVFPAFDVTIVKIHFILLFLCVCFHVRSTCIDFMQIWEVYIQTNWMTQQRSSYVQLLNELFKSFATHSQFWQ